jgi:hypothetical protein
LSLPIQPRNFGREPNQLEKAQIYLDLSLSQGMRNIDLNSKMKLRLVPIAILWQSLYSYKLARL